MSEQTFAGQYFKNEFTEVGLPLLESQRLTEMLYKTFMVMLVEDGWSGKGTFRGGKEDVAASYRNGFYIPCVKRIVLSGQVDIINDGLPKSAGIVCEHKHDIELIAVRKISSFPKDIVCAAQGTKYCVTAMWDEEADRKESRLLGRHARKFNCFYFVVKADGSAVPALEKMNENGTQAVSRGAAYTYRAVCALNAETDAHNLWNVRTSDEVTDGFRAEIRLGVSQEHIKSLFYARSLPVSMLGRKRPILHWVQAHKRRMKIGIDIDIVKHLRGITSFEMDSLPFEITNPPKIPAARKIAA